MDVRQVVEKIDRLFDVLFSLYLWPVLFPAFVKAKIVIFIQ